jgi:hypothetical protein
MNKQTCKTVLLDHVALALSELGHLQQKTETVSVFCWLLQ